jgi:hypothetical protein
MTENLKKRISRIVDTQIGEGLWHPDEVADVLIRELGLQQERQQGPYNHMYRYVTEFESNYE